MNEVTSNPSQRQHLSPWMLIGGLALLAVLVAAALVAVGVVFAPKPDVVPRGVAEAELEDGSVLVLHAVTEGRHELKLPTPSRKPWWERLFEGPSTETFRSYGAGASDWVLWLARYDGQTGQPLPFDRWTHCVVRNDQGAETFDRQYGRRQSQMSATHVGSSNMSGPRPFAPSNPLDPGVYTHILYTSSLPRVRTSTGEVDVEVYDADHGLVTTLIAPTPGGATSAPVWTPVPLPATQADGDVEVTLDALTMTSRKDQPEAVRERRQVKLKTTVRQAGQESALWSHGSVTLVDALGNEAQPYDCDLSPLEMAWKVRLRLFRKDEAALQQAPRMVVEDIALPDTDPATLPNSTPVTDTTILDGVTITLLGVGGPGPVKYQFTSKQTGHSTYHMGAGIEGEFRDTRAVVSIDNSRRHVAMTVDGDTPQQRVTLVLTDQNGVRLKSGSTQHVGEARIWTFDADEWVTAVNLYVVVHRAREVEFTVAPPVGVADE